MGLARGILRNLGWEVTGSIPDELKKCVVIAVPHTSAWDFPLGLLARSAIGRKIKFVGKKSLFTPPLGWLMRALGGIPVDRGKRQRFVQAVADLYDRHDELAITIAPEGTRRKVDRFKTGFYYIAREAGVPIILVSFDYEKREVFFNPEPFYPTDDAEADLAHIWEYFRGIKGKVPENSVI